MASSIGTYKPSTITQPKTTTTASVGIYKPGVATSLGVQAKAPEQNLKPPVTTLKPSEQVKAPAMTFTDEQNKGLLAALARRNSSTANDNDNKNLDYAISKGWKPPVTSSPTPVSPAPTEAKTETKPVDISQTGILNKLVGENLTSQNSQTAQQKMLDLAANNPATSGRAYDDYNKAVAELAKLDQDYAAEKAKMSADPNLSLSFRQGREQILDQQYAARRAALQGAVSSQRDAIGQQISGYSAQQTGYQNVGSLANQGLQLAQGGLGTALNATSPISAPYGTPIINPVTGQQINTAQDLNDTISYWASQVANNKVSLADVPATITGNVQLKTELQRAIQGINPNYNPAIQGANQASAGELTTQKNNLQSAINGVEKNFQLLVNTARQGGVLDNNVPILNTLQQNVAVGLTSNSDVTNFLSTLSEVRAQYANILGGGATTDTSREQARSAIPDNISLASLESLRQQMEKVAKNRIGGIDEQIKSVTSGGSTTSGKTSSGIGYTIITE